MRDTQTSQLSHFERKKDMQKIQLEKSFPTVILQNQKKNIQTKDLIPKDSVKNQRDHLVLENFERDQRDLEELNQKDKDMDTEQNLIQHQDHFEVEDQVDLERDLEQDLERDHRDHLGQAVVVNSSSSTPLNDDNAIAIHTYSIPAGRLSVD